jgi:hypothetical protein
MLLLFNDEDVSPSQSWLSGRVAATADIASNVEKSESKKVRE